MRVHAAQRSPSSRWAAAGEVDRFGVKTRFVESVELLLNRLGAALLLPRPLVSFRTPLIVAFVEGMARKVRVVFRHDPKRTDGGKRPVSSPSSS